MNLSFIWEALVVLFVGFCLLRILGKKTVSEMTGLEIITLLAMASMIGHGIAGDGFGLWRTIVTLCLFVGLLLSIQFLAIKINLIEKLFIGKATLVIKDGQIQYNRIRKLRMTVDQLESKLREKGISTYADIKTGTIEMSGQLGYEWMEHAKPVTMGELQALLAAALPLQPPSKPSAEQPNNIFTEVIYNRHQEAIPKQYE